MSGQLTSPFVSSDRGSHRSIKRYHIKPAGFFKHTHEADPDKFCIAVPIIDYTCPLVTSINYMASQHRFMNTFGSSIAGALNNGIPILSTLTSTVFFIPSGGR
jgi:hypothetical protein